MAAESQLLDAARRGDQKAFRELTERWRREILAHLYRIVGSYHDAEDLAQETFLRAWKGLAAFEGRSSMRTWLHRIAANAALDAVEKREPRVLPDDRGDALRGDQPIAGPEDETPWMGPIPDALIAAGPDTEFAARENIALAFVQAMQRLPARQRVVLLSREVLGMSAEEAAEIVDATVPAVNSMLQRAKETLGDRPRPPMSTRPEIEKQILERYVRAWEDSDPQILVDVMHEDARLLMPPLAGWYRGARAIAAALEAMPLPRGSRGRWKLVATRANGSPAFGAWERDAAGVLRAAAIQVLAINGERIQDVVAFLDPSLFAAFGLPAQL